MPQYYPVFLKLSGRRCVVIGAGRVGEDKAVGLLEQGAEVVVISPDVTDTVRGMARDGRLSWRPRDYRPGDLEGAFVAIAVDSYGDDQGRELYREAQARNVALNVVDAPDWCTWITPAIARRGDVTVAVSTGGASPALARRLRDEVAGTARIRSRYGVMDLAELAPLLSEARGDLRRQGLRVSAEHWQACITDDLVGLLRDGRREEAGVLLMSRLLEGKECDCAPDECRLRDELSPRAHGKADGE